MKKLRKMTSVILGVIISCMCLATPVSAANNSEAAATANIPTHCKHCTMEFLDHNHNTLELIEHSNINATTACDHSGRKSVKYVGTCFCGGMLYRVNCDACGAFVRGLCANNCGYWD